MEDVLGVPPILNSYALTSYFLIGSKGFLTLFHGLQNSASGGGVSNYLGMMNWRMLGGQISQITSINIGLIISIIGSIITIGVTFYYFYKKIDPTSSWMIVAITAIFSATLFNNLACTFSYVNYYDSTYALSSNKKTI